MTFLISIAAFMNSYLEVSYFAKNASTIKGALYFFVKVWIFTRKHQGMIELLMLL